MKRLLVTMLLAASFSVLFSQSQEASSVSFETSRSIFSLNVGFAGDLNGSRGYSVFIKSAAFINESPFYYGFGSLFGEFSNTKESFFETGILIGYNSEKSDSNLYYDLFLDLIVTGGRIDNETSLFQAEAPAVHAGFSLGFPASSNIDGALSIAPVIRPYNLNTGVWDFSRSYINLGITLRSKSFFIGRPMPWSESYKSENMEGGVL